MSLIIACRSASGNGAMSLMCAGTPTPVRMVSDKFSIKVAKRTKPGYWRHSAISSSSMVDVHNRCRLAV
jgi:hypothetical protein